MVFVIAGSITIFLMICTALIAYHFGASAAVKKQTTAEKRLRTRAALMNLASQEMVLALKMLVKENDARARDAAMEKALRPARRILNEVSLLFAVWDDNLRVEIEPCDIKRTISQDIDDFREFVSNTKPDLSVVFSDSGSDIVGVDGALISMCFRGLLSQALHQSESGEVRVHVGVDDPVIQRRADIAITITDASRRPEDAPRRYSFVPGGFEKNPFLKHRASSVVRLNLARMVATKMGGGVKVAYLKNGAARFTLTLQGERCEQPEKTAAPA